MRSFKKQVRGVKDYLRQLIFRGELLEGTRIREEDLREQLNASVRSVREALNDLEREGLIVRKRRVGTFISADLPVAGPTALPRVQSLGILSGYPRSVLGREHYLKMLIAGVRGAMKAPAEVSWWVPPERRLYSPSDLPGIDPASIKQACTGVLAVEAHDAAYLNDLVRAGVPTVAVDFVQQGHMFDVLKVDHTQAGYDATAHLRSLRHRKIAFLGEGPMRRSPDPSWQERLLGYMHAMGESGGERLELWICDIGRAKRHIKTRLPAFHKTHRPTAYVLAGGSSFDEACRVLAELGCEVPRDVSFASADAGLREGAQPTLASARIDYEQVGRAAVPLLAARLACRTMPPMRRVLHPHFCPLRGSVAPPAE